MKTIEITGETIAYNLGRKRKKKKDKPKIFIWHTRAVLGHSFLTGPSKII